MKKENIATILLWSEVESSVSFKMSKLGFLINVLKIDGLLKCKIMGRRLIEEVDNCPSRQIEVDSALIAKLEDYFSYKHSAIMFGELASQVEDALQKNGIISK